MDGKAFLLAIPSLILSAVWGGYVTTVLWSWFIVPTFGMNELSIPVAIGVGVTVRCFTGLWKSAAEDFVEAVIASFTNPLVALTIGWIATWFI